MTLNYQTGQHSKPSKMDNNKKGTYYFNFTPQISEEKRYQADGFAYTNAVKDKELTASQNKIYGLAGNVAEMVQEQGITKGGSWYSTEEKCMIQAKETYHTANAWIGFRCVAEVYCPSDEAKNTILFFIKKELLSLGHQKIIY